MKGPTYFWAWIWLAIAVVLPSLVTWIYFDCLQGQPSFWQQAAYALGKSLQFTLPLVVTYLVGRQQVEWPQPCWRGIGLAIVFGLSAGALVILVYFGWVAGTPLSERLLKSAGDKVIGLGLATPVRFLALGMFYSLCHSLLEEYYWRWFVFGLARKSMHVSIANFLSSAAFMAHHILLLGYFFGFGAWQTWLFSGAIAIGGGFWAWLYQRTKNLSTSWISHAIVDAAIFGLGYWILFGETGLVLE